MWDLARPSHQGGDGAHTTDVAEHALGPVAKTGRPLTGGRGMRSQAVLGNKIIGRMLTSSAKGGAGTAHPVIAPNGSGGMVIRRSLSAADRSLPGGKKGAWAKVADLVDEYNATSGGGGGILDALVTALTEGTMLSGAGALTPRTVAARKLLKEVRKEQELKDTLYEEWRAGKRGEERKAQAKAGSKKMVHNRRTHEILSDFFVRDREDKKTHQQLLEFDMPMFPEGRFGFQKKRGEMVVNVNVKFTGQTAGQQKVEDGIARYWNVFKFTYKSSKSEDQIPPVSKEVKLTFKVGKSARNKIIAASHKQAHLDQTKAMKKTGQKPTVGEKDFENTLGIKAAHPVLLWTGDHPQWEQRLHLGAAGAKTRSDAWNWSLDDGNFDAMVSHEFGHLVGLQDEYSRTHHDLSKIAGKRNVNTDKKGRLTGAHRASYQKIMRGLALAKRDHATDKSLNKALNDLHAALSAHGNKGDVLALWSGHHASKGRGTLDRAVAQVIDLYERRHADAAAQVGMGTKGTIAEKVQAWENSKKPAQRAAAQLNAVRGKLHAPFVTGEWFKYYARWGFRTGGIMGDYTTVTSKKADTRANAIAHDHDHPLEPRHVKRFADFLSNSRNEEWEVGYR